VSLLTKIRAANTGKRLLVVPDNAPYNKAPAVQKAAAALRIQLLYLRTYSSNLNLIERLWKLLKRKVARNRFYPTFADFRSAAQGFLDNLGQHQDELGSFKTERFQLFTAA
jgi:transposase